MAGFAALAASLIAYNASTFAAGIVTGMANGNFSGTMAAVQGSINGAHAIAAGMQQMSQSTHDMSQANKAEAQDKKAEQTTGANAAGDSSYVHPSTTSTPLGQRGDVNSSNSSSSGPSSTNGSVQAPGVTQSQSTQVQSQTNSANGIATSTEVSKASNGSVASVAGTNPSPPVAPAGDKENPLDSPHLKSFEQHLKERYGPGSENLSDKQKNDLDNELKQDKLGMQQDFAGGFNNARDGMMGMIGKGQDQSVGAVQIRSSV